MTIGPAPMIMMDLISVLFGMTGPRHELSRQMSGGIGFECFAQIGVGLRGAARARNPDCGRLWLEAGRAAPVAGVRLKPKPEMPGQSDGSGV